MYNQEVLKNAMPVILGFLLILLVVLLILYVFESIGIMKLAKRKDMENSWLAFVPFARTYMYGKLAFKDKITPIVYLCAEVLSVLVSIEQTVKMFNSLANGVLDQSFNFNAYFVATMIIGIVAVYKIFKKYSDKAILMLVLSILSCGLLAPIFLFAIRNNECKEA